MSSRALVFRFRWLALWVLLAAGAWWTWRTWQAQPAELTKAKAAAPTVSVSTVRSQRGDFPVVLEATGNVAALSTVDLRAQTTSTVKAVHVKEGDFVRTGQLLFTLDDRADRANVEKARAQLARDQASLADAQRQVQRSRELVGQGFLSRSAVDTILTQAEALNAAVLADQAALRAAEIGLTYNTLTSPMDGRVGVITAQPGALVLANATVTPMLTITRMNPVSVNFTLPETLLQAVQRRRAKGAVVVEAWPAGSTQPVKGVLSFIDSTVDTTVGGVRSKAQFDNQDLLLWPGQSSTVQVTVDVLEGVVQVPLASVVTSPTGTMVYVVGKDSVAQPRKVKLLAQSGTMAAVSGLEGDESVVVDGKQNLRPGSVVRDAADAPKP